MDSIYENVGKRIRELRLAQGLTQRELAEKASISVPFLSFLELGQRKGSLQTYADVAKALSMELSELLKDKGAKALYKDLPQSFPGLSVAESTAMLKLVRKIKR